MSKILPQFPLQLVVFPNEELNLHIFDPRYRQLISDCEDHKIIFGIPTVIKKNDPRIGTSVELVKIERTYKDGKMDIKCKGLQSYKIQKFIDPLENKLYAGAEVEFFNQEDDTPDFILSQKIIELVKDLYQFMRINKPINENAMEFRIFQVAHKIGLTLNQELQLLSLLSEKERQDFVYQHLESLLPIVKKMELMRKKIQMNGHFKKRTP